MPMWSSYLVESRDDLFHVVVFFFRGENVHKVAEVAVYKMDFSASASWRKVDGIGVDRVFLLGGHDIGISSFGASCAASACGLTGNCIYFLNHVGESFLHVFDLEKGTEEVQRPFHDIVCHLRLPFWLTSLFVSLRCSRFTVATAEKITANTVTAAEEITGTL
ncbi:hypothetical protein EJB05_34649, partial [Eragrostis curvula]